MPSEGQTKEYRLFGLDEDALRRRLAEWDDPTVEVDCSCDGLDATVSLTGGEEDCRRTADRLCRDLAGYWYTDAGDTLEQCVVRLLREKEKTVSLAESCTGGWIASRLTSVPGCSAVFGTGVVSYSPECKKKLLGVSPDTIRRFGVVSAQTAAEMARGVRRCSGADLGLGITGEAGPVPSEDRPVGTVFLALADSKRVWVREVHLDAPGRDRNAIRYQAASCGLDLIRRYMEAFPTVMAGGERMTPPSGKFHPAKTDVHGISRLFPWHSGSLLYAMLKGAVWLIVLLALIIGLIFGYQAVTAPAVNRQLQDSLVRLYAAEPEDLTGEVTPDRYPVGMLSPFRSLYDINQRIGGWVRIAGTGINGPVMTGSDDFYRNHNFDRQYSPYGQPYFHATNVIGPLAKNRVYAISGKNSRDGQMFSDLLGYRDLAFLREHPVIEMNTLYSMDRWEIFAVLVTDEREWNPIQTAFDNDTAMERYLQEVRRHSLFLSDRTVTAADTVLLLSTEAETEYGFSGARLTVAACRLTSSEDTEKDGFETGPYRKNPSVRMPSAWKRKNATTVKGTTALSAPARTSSGTTEATSPSLTTSVPQTKTTAATEPPAEETEGSDDADPGD